MASDRQWIVAARPSGDIKESDFALRREPIPAIGPGQFLIRNLLLSCDPAMHGWMAGTAGYMTPLGPGDVMLARTVGEIVQSHHPDFKPGERVAGMTGWQDYAVSSGRDRAGKPFQRHDADLPPVLALTLLGSSGVTAYFGLFDIGAPKPGDTVLVSGAAGAVGTITGQLAKLAGCRVIGTAGSDEKCAHLVQSLGYDHCINYKTERVVKALAGVAPRGLDIFFDNVGGATLEAGLSHIARGARIVICGAIAGYGQRQPGPANYMQILLKHATMTGFLQMDYEAQHHLALRRLADWYRAGQLKSAESIVDGFENAPAGLVGMFRGDNVGKRVIRIADAP